ncbi:MAG: nuclear transport factor 2 family protein [Marinicella sp.]
MISLNAKTILLLTVVVLIGCQSKQMHKQDNGSDVQVVNIAEQFVAAYNQHDPDKMLQWVHPDVSYMYVSKDQIYTETSGKVALTDFLGPFFKDKPHAQSQLLGSHQQGPFIHQVEKALWDDKNGQQQSQCSLSVYEIKEELIINIWYFSVFKCPE